MRFRRGKTDKRSLGASWRSDTIFLFQTNLVRFNMPLVGMFVVDLVTHSQSRPRRFDRATSCTDSFATSAQSSAYEMNTIRRGARAIFFLRVRRQVTNAAVHIPMAPTAMAKLHVRERPSNPSGAPFDNPITVEHRVAVAYFVPQLSS